MHLRTLCLVVAGLVPFWSHAQTAVFEDSKGESAIKAFGNSITINAADPNIAFDFNVLKRQRPVRAAKADAGALDLFNRVGVVVKLKADEGISALKNEDGFLVDGQVGVYYGWKKSTRPDPRVEVQVEAYETYLSANLMADRTRLYDLARSSDIVYDQASTGWKLELGRFGYLPSDKVNVLYGVSANVGQRSNLDELTQDDVLLNTTVVNGTTTAKGKKGYQRAAFKTDLINANVNADVAVLLNSGAVAKDDEDFTPIFGSFHLRTNYLEDYKVRVNPALGVYIAKKGAPRSVVTGINVQLLDLFNSQDSENSTWERVSFNLTAGFAIK